MTLSAMGLFQYAYSMLQLSGRFGTRPYRWSIILIATWTYDFMALAQNMNKELM